MKFELVVTKDNQEVSHIVFGYKFEAAIWLERYLRMKQLEAKKYKTLTLYKRLLPCKTNYFKVEVNDIIKIITEKNRKNN